MQEYNELVTTDACNTYLEKADKNIQSVASTFSGTAFPTTNLAVGMQCMRTDDSNNIYKLTSVSPVTWELVPSKSYVDNAVSTGVKSVTNFKGATSTAAGAAGLVPAPIKGQQDTYYLSADGTWKQVQQRTEKQVIDIVYPVGSIWETTTNDDPNTLWAGTTWVKMDAGRVLVAAGSYTESGTTYTYNLGDKGGEAKHQLSTDELANHSHSTSNAGGHQHYIANDNENTGGVLTNSLYMIRKYTYNSYENFELYGSNAGAWIGLTNNSGSHIHSITSTGGNAKHENRMPYIVINRWKRTH
nr:MAG TPA: baseplate wedge protein [Caudoviricetes sp.]